MRSDLKTQRDALAQVVRKCRECLNDRLEIDGGDFQDWQKEAGLISEQPATSEDVERFADYEVELGDPIYRLTPLGREALAE